ncbi:unnamed protein product [Sphenostylis stenocarpa]|uniref:Uncharacterized protein n=1 Tax=Sphenostylis stenocarpa TaxID=92480 RepID=A0AA86SBQ9_9FABA|nr:unnamed protein product [Sphenostylis stenocarpa]
MDKTSGGDKYNIETAEILANEAQHLPVAEATPIYEQLLLLFPTAVSVLVEYFGDILEAIWLKDVLSKKEVQEEE